MRSKRKSAVELLAESKPFYVKSEIVRDNTQVLPVRHSNTSFATANVTAITATTGYGTYTRSKSVNVAGHGTNYRPTTLPQCKFYEFLKFIIFLLFCVRVSWFKDGTYLYFRYIILEKMIQRTTEIFLK